MEFGFDCSPLNWTVEEDGVSRVDEGKQRPRGSRANRGITTDSFMQQRITVIVI